MTRLASGQDRHGAVFGPSILVVVHAFSTHGRAAGAELRHLPAEELLSLAHAPADVRRFGWSTGTISSLIEARQAGTVRVIVRGVLRFPSWSRVGYVAVNGFDRFADRTVRDIPNIEDF